MASIRMVALLRQVCGPLWITHILHLANTLQWGIIQCLTPQHSTAARWKEMRVTWLNPPVTDPILTTAALVSRSVYPIQSQPDGERPDLVTP